MFEVDITEFFYTAASMDYSASVAEIGSTAGEDTWQAAINDSDDFWFVTDDNREDIIGFFEGFGAWDDLEDWSDRDLNALLIQMIAGDIREAELDTDNPDWEDYERRAESGEVSGNLFCSADRVYFQL